MEHIPHKQFIFLISPFGISYSFNTNMEIFYSRLRIEQDLSIFNVGCPSSYPVLFDHLSTIKKDGINFLPGASFQSTQFP